MKKEIETEPDDIESISRRHKTQAQKLRRAYKENISEFNEFYKKHEKMFKEEAFVIPENIGPNMGIDETGLINGDLYTILYNKDGKGKKGSLAAIIKGTKSSVVTEAINEYAPFTRLVGINEITMDLSNSMDWTARQIAPNAIRTYDRFHVERIVTDAMQQVRIDLRWEAIERENKLREQKDEDEVFRLKRYSNGDSEKQLLARSRYFLYKRKSNWTKQQTQRAKILFEEFPSLKKAYELYMGFKDCYSMSKLNAENYLVSWIKRARKSKIKYMITVAKTIENNLGGLLNYLYNRETNAAVENFNRKLKTFLSKVRGVNNKNIFFFRLLQIYA